MTGKGALLLLLAVAPAVVGSAALQPQRLTQAWIAQLPATGAGSGTSGVEGIAVRAEADQMLTDQC